VADHVTPPEPGAAVPAPEPGAVLAAVRTALGLSLAGLAERLRTSGGPALSRQRLSQLERGQRDLPDDEWLRLADALGAAGATIADATLLASAVVARAAARPLPRLDAGSRQRRLAVLAARLAENPRWRRFHTVAAEHAVDLGRLHGETSRRLALAADRRASWRARADDALTVLEPDRCGLRASCADPFLVRPLLHNSGGTPWQDRLLVRLGATVSSSMPFIPGALLVPDTEPGGSCEILVPGKAQWFPNLAEVSYVMVFPDGTQCLPGRLILRIDTRDKDRPDQTFPVPRGLADRLRRRPGTDGLR
jgi:transcriptional regulator with XRE-family HTH domain